MNKIQELSYRITDFIEELFGRLHVLKRNIINFPRKIFLVHEHHGTICPNCGGELYEHKSNYYASLSILCSEDHCNYENILF